MESIEERLEECETALLKITRDLLEIKEGGFSKLSVQKDGLTVKDERGSARISLRLINDSPALILNRENGEPGAFISILDGEPSITITRGDAGGQLEMNVGPESDPTIKFRDEKDEVRLALTIKRGVPLIFLYDEHGNVVEELDGRSR